MSNPVAIRQSSQCTNYRNPSAKVEDGFHAYTVKKGDTMTDIAKRNGLSLETLRDANPQVKNASCIATGDVIRIPNATMAPATTNATSAAGEMSSMPAPYSQDGFESGPGPQCFQPQMSTPASASAAAPVSSMPTMTTAQLMAQSRSNPLVGAHGTATALGVGSATGNVAATSPSTDTNADRTRALNGIKPHADADVTSSGDSAFVTGSLSQGRDARTGVEAQLMGGVVQVGAQNEAQLGMAHVGISSDDGVHSAGMDVMTGRANLGIHNSDGSTGINAGAMATGVGIEGTTGYSGNSVTGGLSLSAGAEGSVGIRDQDGDGSSELCGRASLFFFTLGACVENPF